MPNFQLVNPYIEGEFKSVVSGKNAHDAAQKAWSRLADNLTNNVPKFGFTLERVSDKKLSHFVVKENISDGTVNYKLMEHEVDLSDKEIQGLRDQIESFRHKQSGGKRRGRKGRKGRKDDSDSDSDSDSDVDLEDSSEVYSKVMRKKFVHMSQPIVYFWYNPLLYRLDRVYMPTFVTPLIPYVHIELSSAFF